MDWYYSDTHYLLHFIELHLNCFQTYFVLTGKDHTIDLTIILNNQYMISRFQAQDFPSGFLHIISI